MGGRRPDGGVGDSSQASQTQQLAEFVAGIDSQLRGPSRCGEKVRCNGGGMFDREDGKIKGRIRGLNYRLGRAALLLVGSPGGGGVEEARE